MNKTTVYLLRHGEAEGNISRHFHGHTDSDLTPTGVKQAQLAAQRLANESIDVIYSSDLRRAYKTALAVAEIYELPVRTTPALREIYGGEWENLSWEEVEKLYPDVYYNWDDEPHKLQMPGGENMQEFCDRLVGCIEEMIRNNSGKHILVATHGAAIRAILCYYKGLPMEKQPEVGWQDNTAISVIEFDAPGHGVVKLEGDSRHLGKLSTLMQQDWWKKKGIHVKFHEEECCE